MESCSPSTCRMEEIILIEIESEEEEELLYTVRYIFHVRYRTDRKNPLSCLASIINLVLSVPSIIKWEVWGRGVYIK